jgi:hypothetical protein
MPSSGRNTTLNEFHYATSQKVAFSGSSEIIEFFEVLPAALDREIYLASNKNEYQKQKICISC